MLIIKDLSKIYKMSENVQVNALNKVNLIVDNGEFLAIMGSSGSGKSTLLHLIGGVDTPTSGSIEIDGVNIHKMKPSEQAIYRRQKIGIIYQSYNLIPTLTVEENIILPIILDKRKPDKEDLENLLELLQLKDRRNHLPNQLSGGQQQRTAIGRVFLAKPSIVLADEPTGNLDSQNTEEILQFLCFANKHYCQTIIMVTHDPQVGIMANRKIIMNDGQIISDAKIKNNSGEL